MSTDASDILNTTNPPWTPIIRSHPTASADDESLLYNHGFMQLGGLAAQDDNGMLAITSPNTNNHTPQRTVYPPAGTGSATIYQPFGMLPPAPDSGFAFKLVVISLYELKNTSSTPYTLPLPSPFLLNYMIWTAQCPTIQLLSQGKPQTFNKAASIGNMLTTEQLGQFDWASGIGAVDTIQFGGPDTLTNNGVMVMIGI